MSAAPRPPILSDLLSRGVENLARGTTRGRCIFCGRQTGEGLPPKLGSKFTGGEFLQGGSCICPMCWFVYKTQRFRQSMWVASLAGTRFFKHGDARAILLDPPDPPFAIYLTRTWKKQGWLLLMNRVNLDRDRFLVAEDERLIAVSRADLRLKSELADGMLRQGLTKTTLLEGRLSAYQFTRLRDPRTAERLLAEVRGDPVWELAVWYSPMKRGKLPKKRIQGE